MRFVFFSPISFEPWCWENSIIHGIGGSETSHVELCWRLARRGHEVISYVPLPDHIASGTDWRGTRWFRLEDVDWSLPGWWILYRCPWAIDGDLSTCPTNFQGLIANKHFDHSRTDQPKTLLFQDWEYNFTPRQVSLLTRAAVLCRAHERWLLNGHPYLRGKTWITRNGIKSDLIREVEAEGVPARDPKRIMYASSPDRGLLAALKIVQRAQEFDPGINLKISYGFNNLDKLLAQHPNNPGMQRLAAEKDECLRLAEATGSEFLGRIPQKDLYREWLKTGINVYCTSFWETGYITGLESMALGAVPVFSPIWAQGENIHHGIGIQGDPSDPMTIARFAAEVVRLATNPELQDEIRQQMMPETREHWDWENFADGLERAAAFDLGVSFKAKTLVRDDDGPIHSYTRNGVDTGRQYKMAEYLHPEAPGCYEKDEFGARVTFIENAEPGLVMLDIGAGWGDWSIHAAAKGFHVYAFEPAHTAEYIARLAHENGFQDRLHVMRQAVGDQPDGLVHVNRAPELTGERACPEGGTTVKRTTIDAFVAQTAISHVDYIKIDVEGGELVVLRGAAKTLERCHPNLFIEAYGEDQPAAIESFLKIFGYEVEAKGVGQTWHLKAICPGLPRTPLPRWALEPADRLIYRQATARVDFTDGPEEQESKRLWLKLEPGMVMFDVGACNGSWTIPAARQGARVYAIDPVVATSGIQMRLDEAEIGWGEDDSPVLLFNSPVGHGDKEIAIDSLALEAKLDRLDFIKIDVEGQELPVLQTATATIRRFKPRIMVEVHDQTVKDIHVSPNDIEGFLTSLDVGYTYERRRLLYDGKVYWHLYAEVKPNGATVGS